MYEKEWLPQALSIGISYYDFWDMNPHIINIFTEAKRIQNKEKNAFMHLQGVYMRDAILSSICNSFRGKGTEPYEYPKEPYNIEGERELTEEEKDMQVEQLFANLVLMQERFESNKANTD